MFLREDNFDQMIGEAAATYGLEPAILKALISVTSEFNPYYIDKEASRYGLCGIHLYHAQMAGRSVSPSELMDAEFNVKLAANIFRMMLNGYFAPESYGRKEGDGWSGPNYWDAAKCYSQRSFMVFDFEVSAAQRAYDYFANKPGQPAFCPPGQRSDVSGYGVDR